MLSFVLSLLALIHPLHATADQREVAWQLAKACPTYPHGSGPLCTGMRTTGPSTVSTSTPESPEATWLASRAARCIKRDESGDPAHPSGDYTRGGDEPYGGAWQFSVQTWKGIGFAGVPNQASPAVQDAAAFKLFTVAGYVEWETASGCGV